MTICVLAGTFGAWADEPMPRIAPGDPGWVPALPESTAFAEETVCEEAARDLPCEAVVCDDGPTLSDGLLAEWFEKPQHHYTGFLDFNEYWDTRDFTILTINAGARLPYDIEYFQFLNLQGPFDGSANLLEWTDFFTEIHFRRPIARDVEPLRSLYGSLMWADGSQATHIGRLGIRNAFHEMPNLVGDFLSEDLHLKYWLTFHFYEHNRGGWQMEHVWRWELFDGLAYVGGFADHNLEGFNGRSTWVVETQIGVRLVGGLYAVVEQRYIDFAPPDSINGWGIGIEYAVRFN